ncbi:MAG: 2-oxoacid:ferredoxin oxidoreductase subunit beta, partial [Agriterribacter sp.]
GYKPLLVKVGETYSADDLWIHDEKDFFKAQILVRMFDNPALDGALPRPFGVFYQTDRACYEDVMQLQIEEAIAVKGKGDLNKLLRGNEVWEIE